MFVLYVVDVSNHKKVSKYSINYLVSIDLLSLGLDSAFNVRPYLFTPAGVPTQKHLIHFSLLH